MIAIFYDRKNKCEVRSDELMPIKFGQTTVVVDADRLIDESSRGQKWPDEKYEHEQAYLRWEVLGEFGYKRGNGTSTNWDCWCMLSDLVFLRLESK